MTNPDKITDWTRNSETRNSNESSEFLRLVHIVEGIIRRDSHNLINGQADKTARLIMAQLAHVQGLVPRPRLECPVCKGAGYMENRDLCPECFGRGYSFLRFEETS